MPGDAQASQGDVGHYYIINWTGGWGLYENAVFVLEGTWN